MPATAAPEAPKGKELPLEFFAASSTSSGSNNNIVVDSMYMALFGGIGALFPDENPSWDGDDDVDYRKPGGVSADVAMRALSGTLAPPMGIDALMSSLPDSFPKPSEGSASRHVTGDEMLRFYREYIGPSVIPIFATEKDVPDFGTPDRPEGLRAAMLAVTSLYIPTELLPHPRGSYYRAACAGLFPPVPSLSTIQALLHLGIFTAAMKSVRVADGYVGMAHAFARGIRLHKPSQEHAKTAEDRFREIERRRAFQFLFFQERMAGIIMHRQFLIKDEEMVPLEVAPKSPQDWWLDSWVKQGNVFGHVYRLADPTMGSVAISVPNLQAQFHLCKEEIANFRVDPFVVGESTARWIRLAIRRSEIMLHRIRHLWKTIPKLAALCDPVFGPEPASALDQLALASTLRVDPERMQPAILMVGERQVPVHLMPPYSMYAAFYISIVCIVDSQVSLHEEMIEEAPSSTNVATDLVPGIGRGALRHLAILESACAKDWRCAQALAGEIRRRVALARIEPRQPGAAQGTAAFPPGSEGAGFARMDVTWKHVWETANVEERKGD